MRGVGGVDSWRVGWWVMASAVAGGVDIGLFEAAEFFASEAVESWRGRFGGRAEVADEGMPPPRVVGEAVWVLGYLGRCACSGPRLVPPGEGRAGSCPVLSTAMECEAWGRGIRASCCWLELMAAGEGAITGMGGKYSVCWWRPSSWCA